MALALFLTGTVVAEFNFSFSDGSAPTVFGDFDTDCFDCSEIKKMQSTITTNVYHACRVSIDYDR